MSHFDNRRKSGFTLIELAIVLGVAGLLFGGLWRLLSTGNQQMRDQATASQQTQLIGAISTYLLSTGHQTSTIGGGQAFLASIPPNGNAALDLSCAAAGPTPGLCNFLPAGFSPTTTNPYGQTFQVSAVKDGTGPGIPPQTYSFMIVTVGGDTIPDTSGGRISAMIGGDGGFVYTSTVCGPTPATACGSFGTWVSPIVYSIVPPASPTGFFTANPTAVGHVVSRTYYSPYQNTGSDWLARISMPSDPTANYNTMATSFYLGNTAEYFGLSTTPAGTASTGKMYVQGGTINMSDPTATTQGGTINMQPAGVIALGTNSVISGQPAGGENGGGSIVLNGAMNNPLLPPNPLLQLTGDCSVSDALPAFPPAPNCTGVLQISHGDIYLYNGILQSPTFSYAASDARLKINIMALTDPLADVMKLKPVSFKYKANGKESIGVIAQDLEKVYPQLVLQGRDGMRSVAYDGLIAPLIGSVQELKKENDDLRAQLRDQNVRQEKMERDIEGLRRQ